MFGSRDFFRSRMLFGVTSTSSSSAIHSSAFSSVISREKKLTNIRAAGRDENIIITPHREMGLEAAIEWIGDDELVEVTPLSVRLRKKALDVNARYKLERNRKKGLASEFS